jgi:hypothetical protein
MYLVLAFSTLDKRKKVNSARLKKISKSEYGQRILDLEVGCSVIKTHNIKGSLLYRIL